MDNEFKFFILLLTAGSTMAFIINCFNYLKKDGFYIVGYAEELRQCIFISGFLSVACWCFILAIYLIEKGTL